MGQPDSQVMYWDSIGVTKTFGHPVEFGWLDRLNRTARILDYGCGYGRVTGLLYEHGFEFAEGMDFSPAMIAAARQRWPQLRFTVLTDPPVLPLADSSVDAVTLFAVLTCVPADADQRRLVGELRRVLRNDGLLYVSDMCLQEDEWSRARYERFAATSGTYGVFETDEGALCRHHTRDWLDELLADFMIIAGRDVPVITMNGHSAQAVQLLARKP